MNVLCGEQIHLTLTIHNLNQMTAGRHLHSENMKKKYEIAKYWVTEKVTWTHTQLYIFEQALHSLWRKAKWGKVRTLCRTNQVRWPCLNWAHWPEFDRLHICVVPYIPSLLHTLVFSLKSHYDSYIKVSLGTRIIIPDFAKIGEKAAGYSVSSNNLRSNWQ